MDQCTVIGIAGGTGAGKSTIVEFLKQSVVGNQIAVLAHDEYYWNPEDMDPSIRENENWDHPNAIDNESFLKHMLALRDGKAIERPDYCMKSHRRKATTVCVEPKAILIVEGILLFAVPEIRDQIPWRIFVEASSDERIIRRILRDTNDRSRSLTSVVSQYRSSTRPMHSQWIEPSRCHAHITILNEGESELQKSMEFILGFIQNQLSLNRVIDT